MGLISTWVAGKTREIKRDQHHQFEMNSVVRPMAIKIRAATQITAMEAQLQADKNLAACYAKLKLTDPPE